MRMLGILLDEYIKRKISQNPMIKHRFSYLFSKQQKEHWKHLSEEYGFFPDSEDEYDLPLQGEDGFGDF